MMKTRLSFLIPLFGLLMFVIPSDGSAAEGSDPNKAQEMEAIKYTKTAIEQGKAGKAQELRKHAETALQIAEAANKIKAEDHIADGIKHLKMAVNMGKKGDAKEGTTHAEEALKSLEEGHK
jgi:translation elongation factor EF-1beta